MARRFVSLALVLIAAPVHADEPVAQEGDGDEAAYESVVHAPRRAAEPAVTLDRDDLAVLPGTSGDPFRSIETLPGVNPVATGVPYASIRGAPPAGTRYFVDGVPIPALFHVAFGPAVLPAPLIDRVELHPGAAPIELARHVGGAVSATTRRLAPAAPQLVWDLRLVDSSAILELPVGRRAAVAVSGRWGYPNLVVQAIEPSIDVRYADYQVRARWDASGRDRFTAFVLGSFDDAEHIPADVLGDPLTYDFHRVTARWERRAGDSGQVAISTWAGFDRSQFGRTGVSAWTGGGQASGTVWVSEGVRLRAGLDLEARAYPPPRLPPPSSFDRRDEDGEAFHSVVRERSALLAGVYGELRVVPERLTTVAIGLRADVDEVSGAGDGWVDARVAIRRTLSSVLVLTGSAGTFHQPQAFVIELPGFGSFDLDRDPQRSTQLAEGIELALPWSSSLSVDVFYSDFANLSEYDGLGWPSSESEIMDVEAVFPALPGVSYGVEILLRRALSERVGGWLAYTWSRAERDWPTGRAPASTDRAHVVNLLVSWDLGAGFRLGARLHARSGWPYTPQSAYADMIEPGPRNSRRLPPFARLDLRADKQWTFGRARLGVYLDFVNVTFSGESVGVHYDACGEQCPRIETTPPIVIPTLGLRGEY